MWGDSINNMYGPALDLHGREIHSAPKMNPIWFQGGY